MIAPTKLAKIKLFTNKLEKRYSPPEADPPSAEKNGKRLVNIDPGYVTASKLVLATAKDYYHRIYLDKGIFAEVTLYFKCGGFQSFEWTYPDYKTKGYIETFNRIREIYMQQIESKL